jgi:hypothetical protein
VDNRYQFVSQETVLGAQVPQLPYALLCEQIHDTVLLKLQNEFRYRKLYLCGCPKVFFMARVFFLGI